MSSLTRTSPVAVYPLTECDGVELVISDDETLGVLLSLREVEQLIQHLRDAMPAYWRADHP